MGFLLIIIAVVLALAFYEQIIKLLVYVTYGTLGMLAVSGVILAVLGVVGFYVAIFYNSFS